MTLALLLAVLAQPAGAFDESAPFAVVDERDGLTLSARRLEGSKFSEYRVTTEVAYGVSALCEHLYEWGTKGKDHPGVKLHQVLEDGADRRVVYQQLEQPVVANRDYAMTVVRERLPSGECRVRFWASNEVAPAKPDGWVRMERLWGGWRFEPLGEGRARLTYTLFSDPGGSVPAFLVHGPQRKATLASVRDALAYVQRALESPP
jgi:hypothetical protein